MYPFPVIHYFRLIVQMHGTVNVKVMVPWDVASMFRVKKGPVLQIGTAGFSEI
jgi:hypothetical protein